MAKITLANGMVIEGTAEELTAMAKAFDAKEETLVGKRAKVTKDINGKRDVGYGLIGQGLMKSGAVGEIVEEDEKGIYVKFDDDQPRVNANTKDRQRFFLRHGEYEVITKAEPAPLKEAPLKPGDYVKISGSGDIEGFASHQFEIGEVVVVTIEAKDCAHTDRFRADKLDGSDYWYVHESYAIRATDEEVAEAKQKHAEAKAELARKQAEAKEAERWASIGRKVNEFKKGDIVRKYGKLREVDAIRPRGYFDYERGMTLDGGDWTYMHSVKLITPVEARFDRA